MPDPAVFLDRDGTLIEEAGYASRPEQIRILGGVAQALAELADAGYRLIVVTNQSGIARGYMSEEDLERFHDALDQQLHLLGTAVDAYYACPHHPDPGDTPRPELAVECDCRKPKPGLLLRAADDFHLDLKASWTVGDTWRDVAAGQAAGTRTIKLPADAAHRAPRPSHVAPPTAEARSLAEAARIILGREAALAAEQTADGESPAPADASPDKQPAETTATEVVSHSPSPGERVRDEPAAPPTDEPDARDQPQTVPPAKPLVTVAAPQKEQAAERAPAAQAGSQCARCGRDISPSEIADGSAGGRDGFLLCADCLAQQPREPGAGPDAGPDDLLRLILGELQRLRRAQRPASLSYFRLLAYIVQAAALFFGFGLAVLGDERALYLQIALLLQLLVLALLLFERRS